MPYADPPYRTHVIALTIATALTTMATPTLAQVTTEVDLLSTPSVLEVLSGDATAPIAVESIESVESVESVEGESEITYQSPEIFGEHDRLWLISTRRLSSRARSADFQPPAFAISRLSRRGRSSDSSWEDYVSQLSPDRPVVIYAHGNRLSSCEAIRRSMIVYRHTRARFHDGPIDWVLFSWPSAKTGMLIRDFREKASRTDAQGLYLGWILRHHYGASVPTVLIGYSFGGRVVTGGLHAMAGGSLGGRSLPGDAVVGARFDAGLVAPALENDWMAARGYHGRATQNLDRLLLLFNRRDAVLKRYWLLNQVRGDVALGYSGPRSFGPRDDGSKVSIRSRDCSRFIGLRHDEVDYYTSGCSAGAEMADMIRDAFVTH